MFLLTSKLVVFQVPTLLDRQGAQLLAVAFLVVSRTWISDRIASLNGIFVSLFKHFMIIGIMFLIEVRIISQEPL